MKRKPKDRLLTIGDVIKTHPREGFWGCAVVLNTRGKTGQFNPFCLIGITPLVFQYDYGWGDIAERPLSVLEFDRGVELSPDLYFTRRETCIGIYDARPHPDLPVIGCVDPSSVFIGPLDFDQIGDGAEGKWPLCGCITANLGYEAILVWNKKHSVA
ncbi:MAG: hypothetical protein FWC42_03170 [Proteobacteria bacterium]|nr:hypothetical protein [Pseudomonadota bacterium]